VGIKPHDIVKDGETYMFYWLCKGCHRTIASYKAAKLLEVTPDNHMYKIPYEIFLEKALRELI
jgi:hypothetical protein